MLRWLLLSAAMMMGGAPTLAQSIDGWPSRTVTIIVPNPAGSASDVVARIVARGLGERLGQSVIIDNRAGGDGVIGMRALARAEPDGYTIGLAIPTPFAAVPATSRVPPYDPVNDFAPLALVGKTPYLLAVHPGLGAKTMRDLIMLAKAKPGTLNYSSVGEGSVAHLGMLMLTKRAGIELTHIPYKSTAQSIVDLASGIIHVQLASIPPTLSLYQGGKVGVLAVTSAKRIALLPEVPTAAESGVPDYELSFWLGLFAPAATPQAVVARLNREINTVLNSADVRKALGVQGIDAEPSTPEELRALLQHDIGVFRAIVAASGLKPR